MGKYDGAIDWNVDKERIAWEDARASGGSNGKGDAPRPRTAKFAENFDKIDWSKNDGQKRDMEANSDQ